MSEDYDFPEDQFPPSEAYRVGFTKLREHGFAVMHELRVVICGLTRESVNTLPCLRHRLEAMGQLFDGYRICLYENDSTDATPRVLADWADWNKNVIVQSEILKRAKWEATRDPRRTVEMADYRNRLRRMALRAADDIQADAIIMLDTDVIGGYSLLGLANTFARWQSFDVMASNGIRWNDVVQKYMQYDSWAYRYDNWNQRYYLEVKLQVPDRGAPPLSLLSAFGGMCVYPRQVFEAAEYAGEGDIEHATLHRRLNAAGFTRVFLNPSQLVLYS